jgi:hypothetical protein
MDVFDYRWPTHGHEPTRESAMAAFAKSGGGSSHDKGDDAAYRKSA